MALLRLPREILRAILDHALLDLGLQRLLRLRTVCRLFDDEIVHASSSNLSIRELSAKNLPTSLIARILFDAAFTRRTDSYTHHIIKALQIASRSVQYLYLTHSINGPKNTRLVVEKAACECMARLHQRSLLYSLVNDQGKLSNPSTDPDEPGKCCFALAAYLGLPQEIVLSISTTLSPNPTSYYFSDPLSTASMQGHLHIVLFILRSDPDLDIAKSDALARAAGAGHLPIVQHFFSLSLPFPPKALQAALLDAATHDHLDIFRLVMSHIQTDALPNHVILSCLSSAVSTGSLSTVSYLLETYPQVCQNAALRSDSLPSRDLLQIASDHGHTEIVQMLLSEGHADPFYGRLNNRDSLWLASCRGHVSVMRLLLDAGASVNGYYTTAHVTPIIAAAEKGWPEAIQLLFQRGFNPRENNLRKEWTEGALLGACQYGWPPCVRELARQGVPLEKGNGWYEGDDGSPMKVAWRYKMVGVVETLRELGVRDETDTQEAT